MKTTEMMKQYEAETGECAERRVWHEREFLTDDYIAWLEAKAEAYDRLMSMNSIFENDIQIVLDGNAWCAYRLPFRNLQEDNAGFGATPQMALTALLESELSDGWENV